MERKNVICPHCTKEFDSPETMAAHVLADHRHSDPPSPEGHIRLVINGKAYACEVKPNWTLYQLIHDHLGLTGAKHFCDRGACGSCTVIMEGKPVLSCMILAIECHGKIIETVEGIADAGHPLIDAYVRHHAMQCGYCTPGFVTTSKALLDVNPKPTAQEVKIALSGNLCRCGTYPQHTIAVLEVARKLTTS